MFLKFELSISKLDEDNMFLQKKFSLIVHVCIDSCTQYQKTIHTARKRWKGMVHVLSHGRVLGVPRTREVGHTCRVVSTGLVLQETLGTDYIDSLPSDKIM